MLKPILSAIKHSRTCSVALGFLFCFEREARAPSTVQEQGQETGVLAAGRDPGLCPPRARVPFTAACPHGGVTAQPRLHFPADGCSSAPASVASPTRGPTGPGICPETSRQTRNCQVGSAFPGAFLSRHVGPPARGTARSAESPHAGPAGEGPRGRAWPWRFVPRGSRPRRPRPPQPPPCSPALLGRRRFSELEGLPGAALAARPIRSGPSAQVSRFCSQAPSGGSPGISQPGDPVRQGVLRSCTLAITGQGPAHPFALSPRHTVGSGLPELLPGLSPVRWWSLLL